MPDGQNARKKTTTNVMAEVRIAEKASCQKNGRLDNVTESMENNQINGEQSNQWQF